MLKWDKVNVITVPGGHLLSLKDLSPAPGTAVGIVGAGGHDVPGLGDVDLGPLRDEGVLVAGVAVGVAVHADGAPHAVQFGVAHLANGEGYAWVMKLVTI